MYRIEKLADYHERAGFRCGKTALDEYIARLAGQHDRKNMGRTYVMVLPDDPRVLGFYTLSAGTVEFQNVPDEVQRKLPRHPVPVVHLGRMAIDKTLQGRGLGSILLVDGLKRAEKTCEIVGVFAVEVISKNEQAKRFYVKHGFQEMVDDPLHLYLPMSVIRKLLIAEQIEAVEETAFERG